MLATCFLALASLCAAYSEAQETDAFAAHHERGVELFAKGDFTGAISEFRAAIRLKPAAADVARVGNGGCSVRGERANLVQ